MRGAGVYEKSLDLPLNFAVNLRKLSLKKKGGGRKREGMMERGKEKS